MVVSSERLGTGTTAVLVRNGEDHLRATNSHSEGCTKKVAYKPPVSGGPTCQRSNVYKEQNTYPQEPGIGVENPQFEGVFWRK